MKISVIIPIYNAEKYIHQCIDSVINQTYKDIEVILVDDGSPDNCPQICDEYAEKDCRIKVIHKSNGGLPNARKCGVDNSTGEWVFFVDSDDSLPDGALQTLYQHIDNHCDMIIGSPVLIENKQKTYYQHNIKKKKLNKIEHINALLNRDIFISMCCRLIKRDIINSTAFEMPPNIIWGEDFVTNINLSENINFVNVIDDYIYNYFQRESSMLHAFTCTLDYQKEYLNCLFAPIYRSGIMDSCHNSMLHEKIYALSCSFQDNQVSLRNDFVRGILKDVRITKLRPKEILILVFLPYPPKIRTKLFRFIYNTIKRMSYPKKLFSK